MKSIILTIGVMALVPQASFARGHDGARELRTPSAQVASSSEANDDEKADATDQESLVQPQEEGPRRFIDRPGR